MRCARCGAPVPAPPAGVCCAVCGEPLGGDAASEPGGAGAASSRPSVQEWEDAPPSVQLVIGALPVEGVLLRSSDPPADAPVGSGRPRGSPSARPSARPESERPSRVAGLLRLPPPGFDGPAEDVTQPVQMPEDFVVRDVDGTTRAERPEPRSAPAVASRPRVHRRERRHRGAWRLGVVALVLAALGLLLLGNFWVRGTFG